MKIFVIWLGIVALLFGGLFLGAHLYHGGNPQKILIGIDTSVGMKKQNYRIKTTVRSLMSTRYALFMLVTDKSKLTDWEKKPQIPGEFKFYGPQDLGLFARMEQVVPYDEADKLYFITNTRDNTLKQDFPRAKIIFFE